MLELLVVVAILALLAGISAGAMRQFSNLRVLDAAKADVTVLLVEAREKTLSSQNRMAYGVHFASTSVTLFSGGAYMVSDPSNKVVTLHSRALIATTTLAGGGSNVFFKRLTGETDEVGEVIIVLKSNEAASTTVTINKTGVAGL